MKRVSEVYPMPSRAAYPGPWFIILQGEVRNGKLLTLAGRYQYGFQDENWVDFCQHDLPNAIADPLVLRLLLQQMPALGWYMPYFGPTDYRGFLGQILAAQRRLGDESNFWLNAMPLSGETDRTPMAILIVYPNHGPVHDPKSPAGAPQDARVLDALATAYRQLEHNIKNLAAFVERSRREIIERFAPGLLHHEIGFAVRSLVSQLEEHRDAMRKLTDEFDHPALERELKAIDHQIALSIKLQEITSAFNRFETRASLRPGTLDEALRDAEILLHHRRGEVGANLSWSHHTASKMTLHTDFTLLVHAIVNVLSNAFNAFADSSDKASPRDVVIKLDPTSDADICVLQIFNNGPPISQQDAAYIFDPGFTTRAKGHGQGLLLTRKVCKYLGGNAELLEPASLIQDMRIGFQLTFSRHLSTADGLARELLR